MRIGLIHAPAAVSIFPNLGLGHLRAVLQRRGHAVRVFDHPMPAAALDSFVDRLSRWRPDLVGFSTSSFTEPEALGRAAAALHRAGARLVVGGPLPTMLGQAVFEHLPPEVGHAFVGEAEEQLADFLDGQTCGDWLTRGGTGSPEPDPPPLVANLDALPLPDYGDRPLPDYPIISSRGCPHRCSFCLSPRISGRQVRARGADHFMAEVEQARRRHRFRTLHILDDNFLHNRDRAGEILEALARRRPPLGVELSNGLRGEAVDAGMARLMRRAGVRRACVGIESLDRAVFDRLGKGERLEGVLRGVEHLQRAGIRVQGFMIIGLPGSSEAVERENIGRARRLGIRASWLNALAFPGTRLHAWVEQHGRFIDPRVAGRGNHWSPDSSLSFDTPDFPAEARQRLFLQANMATGNFDFICAGQGPLERVATGLARTLRHAPTELPGFSRWCLEAARRRLPRG